MAKNFGFDKDKYGDELLIDLIRFEDLGPYLSRNPVHTLSYYDITLITRGKGSFILDGTAESIHHGRIFATAPGQVREWRIGRIPEGYALIFEEEFLTRFFNDAGFVRNLALFACTGLSSIVLNRREQIGLTRLLKELEEEIQRFASKDQHVLRAILYRILIMLNRIAVGLRPDSGPKDSGGVAGKFVRAVDAGCRKNRSVAYYARLLCVSPSHLNALVKRNLGIGAKRHIQDRVFLEAKRMLLHSDSRVEEIASLLGFGNPAYFTRAFHRNFRVTPIAFRKKMNP